MTGVQLRCSNCGTSQPTPGPCETCQAGRVRYFCSNHEPGRWLAGPTCRACGASFGGQETSKVAVAAPARAPSGHAPSALGVDPRAFAALERRAETHQLLLRALLTHLAMTSPDSFGAVIGGIVRSKSVPNDVAREVTILVEEIAASLNR